MSLQTIPFEIIDGVGRLNLNRPDRLNNFTTRMHREAADVLEVLGYGYGGRAGCGLWLADHAPV